MIFKELRYLTANTVTDSMLYLTNIFYCDIIEIKGKSLIDFPFVFKNPFKIPI